MRHRPVIAALLAVALALGGPLFGVTTDTVTFKYQVTGLSVAIPPGACGTTVMYTVVDI